MIARLAGRLDENRADAAVIDVGGVGYLVHLSARSMVQLPPVGSQVVLRVQTVVREDAIDLYGFATDVEEQMFILLTGVTHVGPKGALNILSGVDPEELASIIAGRDVAALTKLPGVGKKTAERLLLELKDKVVGLAARPRVADVLPASTGKRADVVSALLGMGYKPSQAERAAEIAEEKAGKEASLDEMLKQALRAVH